MGSNESDSGGNRHEVRRTLAFLIDLVLLITFWQAVTFALHSNSKLWSLALTYLAGPIYSAAFERSPWQATLGKRLMHLKVTDILGGRPSFLQLLKREAIKFSLTLVMERGRDRTGREWTGQAIHDEWADTLVILASTGRY